jgi:hypothetical protein
MEKERKEKLKKAKGEELRANQGEEEKEEKKRKKNGERRTLVTCVWSREDNAIFSANWILTRVRGRFFFIF